MTPSGVLEEDASRDGREEGAGGRSPLGDDEAIDQTETVVILEPSSANDTSVASVSPNTVTAAKLPKPADQAYPLLCTVGAVSESTSLPADGVCGVLFYESLYKRGLNNLTAGLGADVLRFIVLTSHYSSTTLGVSFDISGKDTKRCGKVSSNLSTREAFRSESLLEVFLLSRVQHVRYFLAPKQTAARHVVTAIGVSPAYPADFQGIGELIDQTFAPDIFVAVSHLSIRDDDRPDCLILPPTIYTLPDDLNLTYATTLVSDISAC
ncbi:hypothetical protein MRX96_033219 [Rhipicephalus microplus]